MISFNFQVLLQYLQGKRKPQNNIKQILGLTNIYIINISKLPEFTSPLISMGGEW